MEKFREYSDAYTGVHPFLPPKAKSQSSVVSIFKWYLIGPVLALIRLPLFLVVFLWLALFSAVSSLIFIPFLRRPVQRLHDMLIARVLLLILGFYSISTHYIPSKKQNKTPSMWPIGRNIARGDLIVSNHGSYVELFYLMYRFSPQFTAVPNDWKGTPLKGVVVPQSLLGAFLHTIRDRQVSAKDAKELSAVMQDARKAWRGPVVVFPEGTTTNSQILLGCAPVISSKFDLKDRKTHIISFKYNYNDFSPNYTVGSFLVHLFKLCCQFSNSMEVRYIIDEDIPAAPKSALSMEDWGDQVYSLLASAMQVPRGKIYLDKKLEFKKYYGGYKSNYKKN
jgi:1-acyl-sn-glycerol-3-phosphate acyltransferase